MSVASNAKRSWAKPRLIVYGTVVDVTRQSKYKTTGLGDDVTLCIPNVGPLGPCNTCS